MTILKKRTFLVVLLPSFLSLLLSFSAGATLSGITDNNEGVKLFEKQRLPEAYARFAQSLGQMPFEARVHYNLATSYLANKEFEKAQAEFEQAARTVQNQTDQNSRQLQFVAHFNAAIAATELKQIDQALALYQSALAVNPDSVETKTNIELLIQSQGGGDDSKDKKDDKDKKGEKDPKKDGKGQGQDKDQNKDQNKDQKPPPQQPRQEPQKNQTQPFESKELSQQDAQRIMEELKRQEEEVRARFQNDHVRDVPRDKDW